MVSQGKDYPFIIFMALKFVSTQQVPSIEDKNISPAGMAALLLYFLRERPVTGKDLGSLTIN